MWSMTQTPEFPAPADPQLRAERAAAILSVDTPVTDHGIEFVRGDDEGCQMSLTVRAEQCNSHGICHGGITMFLADTAAAYALNTGEETPRWVTSQQPRTSWHRAAPVRSSRPPRGWAPAPAAPGWWTSP